VNIIIDSVIVVAGGKHMVLKLASYVLRLDNAGKGFFSSALRTIPFEAFGYRRIEAPVGGVTEVSRCCRAMGNGTLALKRYRYLLTFHTGQRLMSRCRIVLPLTRLGPVPVKSSLPFQLSFRCQSESTRRAPLRYRKSVTFTLSAEVTHDVMRFNIPVYNSVFVRHAAVQLESARLFGRLAAAVNGRIC